MKYFLILIAFFWFSCTKDRSCENCPGTSEYKNATIIYGGPVETDGCGWLVKIDSTHSYHADVLDTAFQHDGLAVKIAYEITSDKFICGIAGLQITVIHVDDIKR